MKTIVVELSEIARERCNVILDEMRFVFREKYDNLKNELEAIYADKSNYIVREEVKNNG